MGSEVRIRRSRSTCTQEVDKLRRIEVKPGDEYGDMKVVREVESGGKRQLLCECVTVLNS